VQRTRLRTRRGGAGPISSGPPDFVGVGAASSGVRGWHDLLLKHPEIEPRRPAERELHFFEQFCTREMSDADVASYHARFPRRVGKIAGEWTWRYMYDAWTPLLLHRAAPEAKLLVLVSDPIERYRARLAGGLRDHLLLTDAASRGRYGSQLRNLLSFYEPGMILVLQYERCRLDPAGEYARTLRFLGIGDDFQPERFRLLPPDDEAGFDGRGRGLLRRLKRTVRPRPTGGANRLWPDLEASILADLEPEVLELKTMVPDLDLNLWPSFAHLAAPTSSGGRRTDGSGPA
jgi:hypothetical protein